MGTRKARRLAERTQKKLEAAKWKLAALERGFRVDHPIVVDSASQIEPHIRGMRCPACDVALQVVEHLATRTGRVVKARCPQCGRSPDLHFVLRTSLL